MVELDSRDRALLAGDEGDGRPTAMRILLRLAEVQGAARFIDVTQAHIDGCIYTGDAILRFAETLAERGGRVSVPTTTNVISVDRRRWREQHVPQEWADKAHRLADAYLQMGAQPTFTCAPYAHYAPASWAGMSSSAARRTACAPLSPAGAHGCPGMGGRMNRRVIAGGSTDGAILTTDTPLSLWGGLDAQTGEIIDRHHPLSGEGISGRVLVLPAGRGSSSASAMLLEARVNGCGSAGLLLGGTDEVADHRRHRRRRAVRAADPVLELDGTTSREPLRPRIAPVDPGGHISLDEDHRTEGA